MRSIVTEGVACSVRLSVCLCAYLFVTFVSPAKQAEPIEMPFMGLPHMGPRNHGLDGVKIGQIHLHLAKGDRSAMRPLPNYFAHLFNFLLSEKIENNGR